LYKNGEYSSILINDSPTHEEEEQQQQQQQQQSKS
jgi:hypothetical protein